MDQPKSLVSFEQLPDSALLRLYQLIEQNIIPFSSSTLWRKCRSGQFPTPIKVSANVTGWRVGEVRRWLQKPAAYRQPTGSETYAQAAVIQRPACERCLPGNASPHGESTLTKKYRE